MYVVPSAEEHGDEAAGAELPRGLVAVEVRAIVVVAREVFDDETACGVGVVLRPVFNVEEPNGVTVDPDGKSLLVPEKP